MKVILATNNPGKIHEFKELLKHLPLEIIAQSELGIQDAEETGLSFIENALIKARHAAQQSGLPALADDSGLCVAALHNAPGIYSARYAGKKATAQDNIQALLTHLTKMPHAERHAFFYCALVFITHAADPVPLVCTGKWSGEIIDTPKGTAGFGYDPIFYVPDLKKTAAELPLAIKNNISHRGIALKSLLRLLPENI
jgi:XTP/dITP diphosphohydrolase